LVYHVQQKVSPGKGAHRGGKSVNKKKVNWKEKNNGKEKHPQEEQRERLEE